MPRNYDEMRKKDDRSFVIRGETFVLRRCRPEALEEINEIEEKFTAAKSFKELVAINEERLLFLLEENGDSAERWKKLREQDDDPITYAEITDVSRWAVAEITGLPTLLSAPSESGRGKTAATSKGA